VQWEFHVCQDL